MDRFPVESSAISEIGFSTTVEITFKKGGKYIYTGVPESVFKAFVGAKSRGTFFKENISGVYPFIRVDK